MEQVPPRQQRYDERRRRILDAARGRAEADGWAAVTTRRLAADIGFTQPVLYGHFPQGKAQVVLEVALEGFVALADRCRAALEAAREHGQLGGSPGVVAAVATAYLDFARASPAVYEAMFAQPIETPFATDDTPADLRAGFEVLAEAVGDDARGSATEVFWAALHGAGVLERAGRMLPQARAARVAEITRRFSS